MAGQLFINLFVAFVWMFLQDDLSVPQFSIGFLIGAAIVYSFMIRGKRHEFYLRKFFLTIELLTVFVIELIRANVRVAYLTLHPRLPVRPGFFEVPLQVRSDAAIAIFATMITMTPGTVSVDVSADRQVLYVHALEMDDPVELAQSLKDTFERRILEVLT